MNAINRIHSCTGQLKNFRLPTLTSLQKTVTLVALAMISVLALAGIGLVCCLSNRKKKTEFIQADKAKTSTQLDNKNIAARLEKNRLYAEEQQAKEKAKGFIVGKNSLQNKIEVNLPYQDHVERDIEGENQEVNGRGVGVGRCQGVRETMEDAEIAIHSTFKTKNTEYNFELFGVFDGHGGSKASGYVQGNITEYLTKALEEHNPENPTDEGIFKALKVCCEKLDENYTGSDGTTATFAVILNGKIWVANVGDSRTILVKNKKIVQATEDAKPGITRYKNTIHKLGGYVMNIFGIDRVNQALAVARAIGDKDIKGLGGKCCISPHPKITSFDLDDFKEGYLVLACDGLYDVASTNEVGKAINKMNKSGESVENMAKRLVYQAIADGSKDNVTAIVVKL